MAIECYQCGATFTAKQGLWRHLKVMHGPSAFLWCGRCRYRDKRRDNLRRHYRMCHPEHLEECNTIQRVEEDSRIGGIIMPQPEVPSTKEGGAGPATDGAVPEDGEGPSSPTALPAGEQSPHLAEDASPDPAVISLSPMPISPLVARATPTATPSGKTKAMMQILKSLAPNRTSPVRDDSSVSLPPLSPATVTSPDETESEEERPTKRVKVVAIEETVHRKVIYEGQLIREEDIRRNYWKLVDVNKYLPKP